MTISLYEDNAADLLLIHSETGYNEGDGADTFLHYIEGFVVSGLHYISKTPYIKAPYLQNLPYSLLID